MSKENNTNKTCELKCLKSMSVLNNLSYVNFRIIEESDNQCLVQNRIGDKYLVNKKDIKILS